MLETMRIELAGRQPLLRRDVRVQNRDEGCLVLDARRLRFASPMDLAATVALAHTAAAKGKRISFRMPQDADVASYLQRMDVIKHLPAGAVVEGSPQMGQRTDCSLVLLEVSLLSPATVEDLVTRVGQLTAAHFGAGIAGLVFRGIGELIDNAVSHGHSRLGAFLSAQAYTGATSGHPGLEFAVCDTGIGVLAHLRGNPKYAHTPDALNALACALQPGVTGTNEPRGYGLADLLQITRGGGLGRLVLRSGDGIASVVLRRQGPREAYGTAIPATEGTWAWLRARFP
jgi:hypothetical protein